MHPMSPAKHRETQPSGVLEAAATPAGFGSVILASVLGSTLAWAGRRALFARSMVPNPFAGYEDFAACERAARRRGVRSPGAYCAAVKRRVEG